MASESFARALASALSPRGRRARLGVFCYHQVLDRRDPLRPGEPDQAEFARDAELLGRVFNVIALPEAVGLLAAGRLPPRAVCITFDDGYENNHRLAAPILSRAGLPATIYVATDAVDRGIMWNDLVIETIAKCGPACDFTAFERPGEANWQPAPGVSPVAEILARLKYLPPRQRLAIAERFHAANAGEDTPRLMMDRAMVADLSRQGFDIGAHTVNHPILQELADDEAQREIAGSAAWVCEVTGVAPRSFAYPNGAPGRDFGPRHAAMAKQAGFDSAVSTEWSLADAAVDRYSIPRIGPWWRQGRGLVAGLARTYIKSYLSR